MKQVAVTTFVDDNPNLIEEFEWLYKSWVYSGAFETSDLIVFHHPAVADKLVHDPSVKKIPVTPYTEIDHAWAEYKFINSVHYLTTEEAQFLKDYRYLLRTDNDTFLTPNFKNLCPRLPMFGIGGYVRTSEVSARLAYVAQKLKLNFCFIHNVGSTIFYKASSVLLFSKHQLSLCKILAATEFPEYGVWPGWYKGVLTMYAGELAANDIYDYGITLGGFDCMSMSGDPIGTTDYHIHAFHTDQYFSKLAWRKGAYDAVDVTKIQPTTLQDYCLFLAKTPVETLFDMVGYGRDRICSV